jgi:hypothetical protein
VELTAKQIDELLEQLDLEGHPRIVPIVDAAAVEVPAAWQELVGRADAHRRVVSALWSTLEPRLPNTVRQLTRRVRALALAVTEAHPVSLLYLFSGDHELYAQRGFPPAASLPPAAARLKVRLGEFYRVHDGWVDLFGGDGGPRPVAAWRHVPPGDPEGFLEIYSSGTTSLGFDLGETTPGCYEIIPDEDRVEPLADFWAALDERIVQNLEDLDSNARD